MSTLGKALAALNILAALALGALIAMDYGKRQSWAYSVLRYDLAIKGLPLSKDDLGQDGKPIVDDLGKQTLQELFSQAGGQPVATQIDEVGRVEQKIQSKIQEAGEDKTKQAYVMARYLIPLATTNYQREEYVGGRTNLEKDETVKLLKSHLESGFGWCVEILRKDTRKRSFGEAFDEGLRYVRGEPTRPFNQAFVKALSRDQNPDQVLKLVQDVVKTFPAILTDQQMAAMRLRVLQTLRGDPAKPWQALIDETFDEAVEIVRADFQAQLDAAIKEAKTGQRPGPDGQTKKSDPEEHRQIIARLLFAMLEPLADDDAGGQEAAKPDAAEEAAKPDLEQSQAFKRFITVVGLENAVREISMNAQTLARISYDLGIEMDRERGDFVVAYQDLLAIVQDRAARYEVRRSFLENKRNQLTLQQDLVRRREAEIKRLEGEIATARQATGEKREELKKMSQGLFDLRIQLRDSTAKNQELEKKIRELEEGR